MSKGIAIFATGSGSNAEKIIEHFSHSEIAEVRLVVSNKPEAYVMTRAANHKIPTHYISNSDLKNTDNLLAVLKEAKIDLIALAGFLALIPSYLIENYTITNIHPALLPKYGGKGMYGSKVHQAVFDHNERESGMTIHYVNEHYDEGKVIFQARTELLVTDTPDIIAQKVLTLEHAHYAPVLEDLLTNLG